VTCEVVFADPSQPIYFGRAAQVKKNHNRFVPVMFTLVPNFFTFFQFLKSDNFPIFFLRSDKVHFAFCGLARGWEQINFVELGSVSCPRLAEMAIEIWVMCQLTKILFETSLFR